MSSAMESHYWLEFSKLNSYSGLFLWRKLEKWCYGCYLEPVEEKWHINLTNKFQRKQKKCAFDRLKLSYWAMISWHSWTITQDHLDEAQILKRLPTSVQFPLFSELTIQRLFQRIMFRYATISKQMWEKKESEFLTSSLKQLYNW